MAQLLSVLVLVVVLVLCEGLGTKYLPVRSRID